MHDRPTYMNDCTVWKIQQSPVLAIDINLGISILRRVTIERI